MLRLLKYWAIGLCVLSPMSWAEKVLTQLEHQQVITVKPKETIVVKLPTNPSTGYMWFLAGDNANTQTMKMTQNWKFIPRDKNELQPIGDTTWRFSAQQEGEITLRFIYRKPWQGAEIEPLDVREFTLIISKTAQDQG